MRNTLVLAAWFVAAGVVSAQELAKPVRILAGGKPIDVDVGHAAPYVVDWNGDGKRDLLVGQFGEGKLRIYLGQGEKDAMSFGDFEWFEAGGVVAKTPAG